MATRPRAAPPRTLALAACQDPGGHAVVMRPGGWGPPSLGGCASANDDAALGGPEQGPALEPLETAAPLILFRCHRVA